MSPHEMLPAMLGAVSIEAAPWKGAALLVFLAVWLGIAARLVIRGRRPYDAAARIPLEDDGNGAAR